jgi:hypothetical protein
MEPNHTETTHESFELLYLDPHRIRFGYDGENLVFIDSDGTYYPRVTLRRSFPLSAENSYILVRLPDMDMERGKELGIIQDSQELDEESFKAVQRELRLHYLVPTIQNINGIHEEFGFLYWSVETDRGHKDFIMRDSIIGSTRQVSPGRWLIIDINQTRYEVHDLEKLDTNSQELLTKYLLI